MKIDLTRDTFRADNHFLRVRMQQGRVQLDADANERDDLFWHHVLTLTSDLIGPNWGPGLSFRAALNPYDPGTLLLYPGRYYANALPAELAEPEVIGTLDGSTLILKGFKQDKDNPVVGRRVVDGATFALAGPQAAPGVLISLHVCEELVTYIEDGRIREVALDGPDTTARTRLVWWVEGRAVDPAWGLYFKVAWKQAQGLLKDKTLSGEEGQAGRLAARAAKKVDDGGPCVLTPEARYRGLENQLYRVEIIEAGTTLDAEKKPTPDQGAPRFAWSRDNGAVVAPIEKFLNKKEVLIDPIGREGVLGFVAGQWVELTNGERENGSRLGKLVKLQSVEGPLLKLVEEVDNDRFTKVRRWDSQGDYPMAFLAEAGRWLPLEDGVEVKFEPGKKYQAGSYWLIPARTALGDVEWDKDNGQPRWEPPRRPRCYEAPLALISKPAPDKPAEVVDLRTTVPRSVLGKPPRVFDAIKDLMPDMNAPLPPLQYRLVGVGYQKFKANGNQWEPVLDHEVTLYDEQGAVVGRHFQEAKDKFVWEGLDGSKAVSLKVTAVAHSPKELTLLRVLLEEKKSPDNHGVFGKTSLIQRVNTVGGGPPSAPVGETKEVNRPFLATYYCYGLP